MNPFEIDPTQCNKNKSDESREMPVSEENEPELIAVVQGLTGIIEELSDTRPEMAIPLTSLQKRIYDLLPQLSASGGKYTTYRELMTKLHKQRENISSQISAIRKKGVTICKVPLEERATNGSLQVGIYIDDSAVKFIPTLTESQALKNREEQKKILFQNHLHSDSTSLDVISESYQNHLELGDSRNPEKPYIPPLIDSISDVAPLRGFQRGGVNPLQASRSKEANHILQDLINRTRAGQNKTQSEEDTSEQH